MAEKQEIKKEKKGEVKEVKQNKSTTIEQEVLKELPKVEPKKEPEPSFTLTAELKNTPEGKLHLSGTTEARNVNADIIAQIFAHLISNTAPDKDMLMQIVYSMLKILGPKMGIDENVEEEKDDIESILIGCKSASDVMALVKELFSWGNLECTCMS